MLRSLQVVYIFLYFQNVELASYKAAVVEFKPKRVETDKPPQIMQKNVHEYVKLIEQAGKQKVQIIVFPEDGVSTIDAGSLIGEGLGEYSISIPEPNQRASPCNGSSDAVLRDLSCAAIANNMYVVVNLVDRKEVNASKEYYNTNVVFDPRGVVIAKYYKINLYYEFGFTPGTEVVTFRTDFNVTFGMFICFDILFENPSTKLLENTDVTDVIYPVAWFSETPYLTALSTQAAYARALGINLLASGYNRPQEKNGGSGIYLADGSIASAYVSGNAGSKLLIADVPIISKRSPPDTCSDLVSNENVVLSENAQNFSTYSESFENYTLESLESGNKTKKKVCSLDFCCDFEVVLAEETFENASYRYFLAVFHGVRQLGTLTAGLRTCGIVACETNEVSTCGKRNSNSTTVLFSSISISGRFHINPDISDRPASLNTNLTPGNAYTYCASPTKDGRIDVEMATKNQDSLLAFGIYGRMYGLDGKPTGVYRVEDVSGSVRSIVVVVGVLVGLVVMALVCAFFVYRRTEKYRSMEM